MTALIFVYGFPLMKEELRTWLSHTPEFEDFLTTLVQLPNPKYEFYSKPGLFKQIEGTMQQMVRGLQVPSPPKIVLANDDYAEDFQAFVSEGKNANTFPNAEDLFIGFVLADSDVDDEITYAVSQVQRKVTPEIREAVSVLKSQLGGTHETDLYAVLLE
jgi:hypothetical protein